MRASGAKRARCWSAWWWSAGRARERRRWSWRRRATSRRWRRRRRRRRSGMERTPCTIGRRRKRGRRRRTKRRRIGPRTSSTPRTRWRISTTRRGIEGEGGTRRRRRPRAQVPPRPRRPRRGNVRIPTPPPPRRPTRPLRPLRQQVPRLATVRIRLKISYRTRPRGTGRTASPSTRRTNRLTTSTWRRDWPRTNVCDARNTFFPTSDTFCPTWTTCSRARSSTREPQRGKGNGGNGRP